MYRMDPMHLAVQPGPGPDRQPSLVWRTKTGGAARSPILGNGTLFIGSDDGFLYALNARTGVDRWRLNLGGVSNVPVYGDGVVAAADRNGALHGVDAVTGAERWRTDPVLNGGLPVLANGVVYATGNDHRAHGFDLQTGVERWAWSAPADLGGALAVAEDAAYVESTGGVMHAVALDGSGERWSFEMTIPGAMSIPIVAADVVLVASLQGAGDPAGELYAVDRSTGKLVWRFRGPSGLQVSPGSVRDGILYAPTEADGIFALRIADGSQLWHAPGPRVFFPTALVGDALYLASDTPPEIAAVRASDGSPLWTVPLEEIPRGNPVVSGGMLFEASASGEVDAFGSATVAPGPTPTALDLASPGDAAVPNPFAIRGAYDAIELALDRPIALAIGRDGSAYVTDSSDRVSQISADGAVIRRWGKKGTHAGEFDFAGPNPEDGVHGSIAVGPDGDVYVSDSGNHRVEVFGGDGTFIRQFGAFGTGDGQFVMPFDLSVDPTGSVYVIDDVLMRVSKFEADGAFVWTVDGASDSELQGHVHDADIDAKGRIVLGNDDTGRVVYMNGDGSVVDAFSAPVCEVTIDPADDLYVGGCGSDGIQVYDPQHRLIGSWSGPDMALAGPPQFGPKGEILAIDRDGRIVALSVTLPPSLP